MIEDLIARLEAANAPDRDLDMAITKVLWDGATVTQACKLGLSLRDPAHYTGDLDAARQLSDWIMTHASDIGADGLPLVVLGDPSTTPAREVQGIALGGCGRGALARAFCIAALRAHLLDHPQPNHSADPGKMVPVPLKLLKEAHACMRECGWQLAPAVDDGSDGVLQAAVADVEDRFRTLLEGLAA